MNMSRLLQSIPEPPEVHVSGTKIPFTSDWLYRVSVDGRLKDEINSRRPWTASEIIDVQKAYTEALTGYAPGGEYLEGWTPPTNPVIRKPVFQRNRRTARAVEE